MGFHCDFNLLLCRLRVTRCAEFLLKMIKRKEIWQSRWNFRKLSVLRMKERTRSGGDLCSNAWLDSLHSRNNLHYAMFKKFQQNKNKNFFLYWLLFRYSCNKFLINFPQLRNHENENSHLSRKQIFAKLAQLRWADKNNFHSGNKISADFHICSMCPCRELIN